MAWATCAITSRSITTPTAYPTAPTIVRSFLIPTGATRRRGGWWRGGGYEEWVRGGAVRCEAAKTGARGGGSSSDTRSAGGEGAIRILVSVPGAVVGGGRAPPLACRAVGFQSRRVN